MLGGLGAVPATGKGQGTMIFWLTIVTLLFLICIAALGFQTSWRKFQSYQKD